MENVRRISVSEMAPHVHSFGVGENKVNKLSSWLIEWIVLSLNCGKIKPYDLLPSKGDLACHIGVSQGTMQNVFRIVEDAGYVESKQRIGTYIKDFKKETSVCKLTSKREMAVDTIKKYLQENAYQKGDILISTRKLSKILGISNTTLISAFKYLLSRGVISKDENRFIVSDLDFKVNNICSKTLVEKVAENLKDYIQKNLESGSKLPSNSELAKMFKVSLKTIHDSIKLLAKDGLLHPRRGRYGTKVLGSFVGNNVMELYTYEKIEQRIRQYITENCKAGDKLPSIREFAFNLETSEKTVKKALDNLAEDGYVAFTRGRYGGTFVLDIPQTSGEAYKWLAINSDYVSNMDN